MVEEELSLLIENAKKLILQAEDIAVVEQLRVRYLGKKGEITDLLKELSTLPAEQRPEAGKVINIAKREVQDLLTQRTLDLQQQSLQQKLVTETIDVTLPGRGEAFGSIHPVSRVSQRAVELFSSMGFSVAEGPEVEDEYHNFNALNIPEHHPARQTQDTFYFPNGLLLRTHTSPVQIRVMKKQSPPLRIITPGRVYRRDSDQTHTPMFHQLEGLLIDRHCTFADLKAILKEFFSCFFERDIKLRFRPSYFPFTEPSAEVDIEWKNGWLEVMGCGMVHPKVLQNVGINPDEFTGFAFGLGLDRLAMLRYDIRDLRSMFENDLRFLEQFI